MKRWPFLIMSLLLLASCGSRPMARPFVARAPAKPAKKPTPKASAGRVTFVGFSRQQLADFWVIPEDQGKGFTPRNESYDRVDGFWWRGEPEAWFKIPDLSEARVGRDLAAFDEDLSRGELQIASRTKAFFKVVDALGVKQGRPAWVPDDGRTRAPVRRPTGF